MNILVTGGSGFIGTNLVSDLLKDGHKVLIYDKRKSNSYPDKCIVGDIRDRKKLANSLRGFDAVYHLAAEHRDDVCPASLYYDVNVGGAENLIYALEECEVKKLIFTSTVALYGLNAGQPDENSAANPFNEYGTSKFEAERIFREWFEAKHSRCLVIVRPTVIFGENNRGNVYNLLNQIASGHFFMVGDGNNKKSMGYVRNISKFLVLLLQAEPGIHIYNYADKPDLTMNELVEIALNTLERKPKISVRVPYVIGLVAGYFFDILSRVTGKKYPMSSIRIKKFCASTVVLAGKLSKVGFVPEYSLRDGLERTISWEFQKR